MIKPPPAAELDRLVTGYCLSQPIYVAAELGIADRLAAGPRPADELAAETGATIGRFTGCSAPWRASASSPKTGRGGSG